MVNCNNCRISIFRNLFHRFKKPEDLKEYESKNGWTYGETLFFCSKECIEEFKKQYDIEEIED